MNRGDKPGRREIALPILAYGRDSIA